MSFFRLLRIIALLAVLAIVAGTQWLDQSRMASWKRAVWVTIYPVVTEGEGAARPYVNSLRPESFDPVNRFFEREARRHGLSLVRPLIFQLAAPLRQPPPPLPPQGSRLDTALWSLRMRWWAWRRAREDGLPGADIQLFVRYRPVGGAALLDRSVGVRKGMYGIVNAYASRAYAGRNRVVLAHELLHVLGASDKYDLATGQPRVPEGLADPRRSPLYPQTRAEIMGGRIALSPRTSTMPASLRDCMLGSLTAAEIGWRGASGSERH